MDGNISTAATTTTLDPNICSNSPRVTPRHPFAPAANMGIVRHGIRRGAFDGKVIAIRERCEQPN